MKRKQPPKRILLERSPRRSIPPKDGQKNTIVKMARRQSIVQMRRRSSISAFADKIVSGFRRKSSVQFDDVFGPQKLAEVRELIQENAETKPELYDARDLMWLEKDDDLVRRFLRIHCEATNIVRQASLALDDFLLWRKELGVNDIKIGDLPREFFEWGVVSVHEQEDGDLWLHMQMNLWKKSPEFTEVWTRFLIYYAERFLTKNGYNTNKRFCNFCDLKDLAFREADLPGSFKMIEVAAKYPDLYRKSYMIDMHWMMKPIMVACNKFMPERYRRLVTVTSRKELLNEFEYEDLPKSLGGKRVPKFEAPLGTSSLEQVAAKFGISDSAAENMLKHINECKKKLAK